jgi:arginyl-tRNA synthetase
MSPFLLRTQLQQASEAAVLAIWPAEAAQIEVQIQDTPAGKAGDYGTPVAFALAKLLRGNPAAIAKTLLERIVLPAGVARAEVMGPYINFFLEASNFIAATVAQKYQAKPLGQKVIVEHTSVNPNKEWHVGHIRGAVIGDAMGKLYRAAGYEVEIQNYIDDTGRQAAESLFAKDFYKDAAGGTWDGLQKYDHWLGELYVRLNKQFDENVKGGKAPIDEGVTAVIHQLESGELRGEVEKIVRAHLETAASLGIEYDLLVWESDIVREGFVQKALDILLSSPHLVRPSEGKYLGAVCIDLLPFKSGLEEPLSVLVRSNGTTTYACKDIGYHYWKFGLFEGLSFAPFSKQASGKPLWTSSQNGQQQLAGVRFAHAQYAINAIDARQEHPQMIVKAGLGITESGSVAAENHHHLAFETVLLDGATMSGRKGIVVAADDVIAEAKERALAVVQADNSELAADHERALEVARMVGIGALKVAFLKAEPKSQINFRWETALALSGDTAPVVQYAHARARRIGRKLVLEGIALGAPDYTQLGQLELDLAKVVVRYSDVLALCIRNVSPHPMVAYALELAAAFNGYYNHKDKNGKSDTSIKDAAPGLREARLAVVNRVADALADALAVLGIEAPAEM